jgi:hypothetical protein
MLLLYRTRYGGLAVIVAFFTAVYLVAGFSLTPLNATRKIFLSGFAAAVLGVVIDAVSAARWKRLGPPASAALAVAAGLWVFWPLLAQKETGEALTKGAAIVAALAWLAAFAQWKLAGDGVRAGSALLGTALGVGIAAILAASATYGTYGIALGAGAGAFLLVQMIRGRESTAGATLALPGALLCGLIPAGTLMLAQLPLSSLLVIALAPLGSLIPLPRMPLWARAVLWSVASLAIAGVGCYLAWHA